MRCVVVDAMVVAAAFLERRVLRISLIMAAVAFASLLINLALGYAESVISELLVIAIPACGYYGVRNRSEDLLQWFWISNACCVCLGILSLFVTLGVTLPLVSCYCDPECRSNSFPSSVRASPSDQQTSPFEGLDAICGAEAQFRTGLFLRALVTLAQVVLQCSAYVYGRRLSDLSVAMIAGSRPPVATFARLQQLGDISLTAGTEGVADIELGRQPLGETTHPPRQHDIGPLRRGTTIRIPGSN